MLERLNFILGLCVGEGTQDRDRIIIIIIIIIIVVSRSRTVRNQIHKSATRIYR